MWRRALLAAAAVSYLICVLIMSGMQKEDLDVSMLRKLQRYDVNLDDINNEQLRQQCMSSHNGTETDDQENKIKESYVSTTELTTITTSDPSASVNLNADNILKYLAREDSVRNLDEAIETSSQISVTAATKLADNTPKNDMDLLRRYIQLKTKKKSFYKLDDNSERTKLGTTVNLKTNEGNFNAANDITIIDELIKEYLLRKQKMPTTTEHTTKKYTVDIQNIYKQIDTILAKDSKIVESKTVANYPNKDEQNNTENYVINPVNEMAVSQMGPFPTEKRLYESFYDFISAMNLYRSNMTRPLLSYDDNRYSKNKTQKADVLLPPHKNLKGNNIEPTINKTNSENEPDQKSLTPSLAKEIAETVKKVLIKDLRNELADIYKKTAQRNTEIPTTIKIMTETSHTTTSNSGLLEKNMAIIDKFMDLYEQIKSLKQAKFLFKANNESSTLIDVFKQPVKSHVNSAMIMPLGNGLQAPEAKVPIPLNVNYNTKPFITYNSYLPRKENNRRLPITIQTNSVEIQPLAIPVSKPESLIRQNIVVHPQYRLRGRQDHYMRQLSSRGNVYSDTNISTKPKNITHKYSQMKRYGGYNSARYPLNNFQEPKQTEDIIRFRMRDNGNSRFDTDYYEKINFGNERNGVNEKHGAFHNRNIPRFHERLERVETESDGIPGVSDSDAAGKYEQRPDFPSRHQLSLVDMKKGTSYDDAHFKNFLKTQQKVTDVLERILATRPKTNTPRSVETA